MTLTRDFWLMTTEITQQQFQEVMGENPSYFSPDGGGPDCGLDCPVEQTTWHEVAAYTNALSRAEGLEECYECSSLGPDLSCRPNASYAAPYDCPGYRLPTEAEWEYAARGGTTTATYLGDLAVDSCEASTLLDEITWYCGNSNAATHPVAINTPNDYGLYDMLGNVYEWCHDWFGYYPEGPVTDPTGPALGVRRVVRGCSWHSVAERARAAFRNHNEPDARYEGFGGRVARSGP